MLKKRIFLISLTILVLFLILELAGYYLSTRHNITTDESKKTKSSSLTRLKAKKNFLETRLANLYPRGSYIVIDTAANRLYMRKNSKTIREMIVSTGSGSILEDPSGDRKWVFDTPRGVLTVQSKKIDPVWTKPDWAFIENGESIPKDLKDRMEEGVLGDYALDLGNGYLIHGTLYTRLLGRNITHGCVRVGDEDLKTLYNTAAIGTKVIIF